MRHVSAGAAGLAAYVFASVIAPLAHIELEHRPRGPVASVDPDRFKDARGDIDLVKLAAALGLADANEPSTPHSHGPGDAPHSHQRPLEHGAGTAQHFGGALLIPANTAVLHLTEAPPFLAVLCPELRAPLLPQWELDCAWPQGPPV